MMPSFQHPMRAARGVLRRVARRSRVVIWWAPTSAAAAPGKAGYTLMRIRPGASASDVALAEDAMRMAGEPAGLVAPRLTQGDDLFAWQSDGRIASFGWVTYRDRSIGPVRLADSPGRAFLYNFHTLDAHRCRGLLTGLLQAVRSTLGGEGVTDLVGDVNVRNIASTRANEKAGFVPVVRVAFLTLLNRWRVPLQPTVLADGGRHILPR